MFIQFFVRTGLISDRFHTAFNREKQTTKIENVTQAIVD